MTVDIERIKGKIRALLNRNVEKGATIAEAEACLDKAYKLLEKFNLDIMEILKDTDEQTQKVIEDIIYECGNIPPELENLYISVADLFNCDLITSRKYVEGSRYRRVFLKCIGNPINVEKVKYFMQLFEDTIREALKVEKISGLRNINSFKRGFYWALATKAQKLQKEREKEEKQKEEEFGSKSCTALMVIEDKKNIETYISEHFTNLKKGKISFSNFGKATDYNSYDKGHEYGNSVGFNDAVGNKKALLKG